MIGVSSIKELLVENVLKPLIFLSDLITQNTASNTRINKYTEIESV